MATPRLENEKRLRIKAEDELVRVTTAKEKLQVWSVAGFRQQQHCCFAFLFFAFAFAFVFA